MIRSVKMFGLAMITSPIINFDVLIKQASLEKIAEEAIPDVKLFDYAVYVEDLESSIE